MQEGQCRNFTGVQDKACRVGIAYDAATVTHEPITIGPGRSATRSFPCLGPDSNAAGVVCPKFEVVTEADLAARRAQVERAMDCLRRGVSKCCEAPIDDSRVIKAGRHKGHGIRYCSKCGRVQFVV